MQSAPGKRRVSESKLSPPEPHNQIESCALGETCRAASSSGLEILLMMQEVAERR